MSKFLHCCWVFTELYSLTKDTSNVGRESDEFVDLPGTNLGWSNWCRRNTKLHISKIHKWTPTATCVPHMAVFCLTGLKSQFDDKVTPWLVGSDDIPLATSTQKSATPSKTPTKLSLTKRSSQSATPKKSSPAKATGKTKSTPKRPVGRPRKDCDGLPSFLSKL